MRFLALLYQVRKFLLAKTFDWLLKTMFLPPLSVSVKWMQKCHSSHFWNLPTQKKTFSMRTNILGFRTQFWHFRQSYFESRRHCNLKTTQKVNQKFDWFKKLKGTYIYQKKNLLTSINIRNHNVGCSSVQFWHKSLIFWFGRSDEEGKSIKRAVSFFPHLCPQSQSFSFCHFNKIFCQ